MIKKDILSFFQPIMILLIDNYDSFVFNLARYFEELNQSVLVKRNNCTTLQEIRNIKPKAIIISPGPCSPNEAGLSNDVIAAFSGEIPILGVCLGHQCIGQVYGGKVKRAPKPIHGKVDFIHHHEKDIFSNLKNPLQVTRYHSLIVEKESLPACLEATAFNKEGLVMALKHREYHVYGVQFHPEAVLTEQGHNILKNFLNVSLAHI